MKETAAEFQKVMTFESLLLKDTHVNVSARVMHPIYTYVYLVYTVASPMPILGDKRANVSNHLKK